jgi:hypothetical protein
MTKIWVQSVSPNNLHGFRNGQLNLNSLEDGLNVVFASNATGKSTLAKAIVNLFQPDALDVGATVNGVVWTGTSFQSLARRRRDEPFPGFPGRTLDYYLDLGSLLEGLGKNSSIEQFLGDGYTFAEPIKVSRPDQSKEVKETRHLLDSLRNARRAKEQLLTEEETLPELKHRAKEAKEAHLNLIALESLLRHSGWAEQKRDAIQALEGLIRDHPGLGSQDSGKLGELDLNLKEHDRLIDQLRTVRAQLASNGGEIAPALACSEADIEVLEKRVSKAEAASLSIEKLDPRIALEKSKLESEKKLLFSLGHVGDADNFPELNQSHFAEISQVASLADREREIEGKSISLRQASAEFEKEERSTNDELDQARRKLIAWLEWESPESKPLNWVPIAGAAALIIALALAPNLAIRLVGTILACIGSVFWAIRRSPTESTAKPSLHDLPGKFACPQPSTEKVANLLEKISEVKGRLRVKQNLDLLIESSEPKPKDWRTILGPLVLNYETPYALAPLVQSIQRYHEAKREFQILSDEQEFHFSVLTQIRIEIIEFYGRFGFCSTQGHEVDEAPKFKAWVLAHRNQAELNQQLFSMKTGLHAFLSAQGTPESDEIDERVRGYRERIPLTVQRDELKNSADRLDVRLDAQPLDRPRLEKCLGIRSIGSLDAIETSAIQESIEAQETLAGELESREAKYQDLLARLTAAGAEHSVETFERQYRESLLKVEKRWTNSCREAVASRVGEAIRARLMTEDLPSLLVKANNKLDRFSKGRYRVEFANTPDEHIGILTVSDLFDGKKQPFKHLSAGTKVHTLLALRLALIEEQEQSTNQGTLTFPLLVDEPMAVSDPESSRAIAETLVQVSKDRQVVLFTSQSSDVSLLKSLDPNLIVHLLGETRPEVWPEPSVNLARTRLKPSVADFDPRVPIGAMRVGSIFGEDLSGGYARIDQSPLGDEQRRVVEALEDIRLELLSAHPRLSWDECRGQKWAVTEYATKLEEGLEKGIGCPHKFLTFIEKSRSKSFNKNQVDAASSWLSDNRFLPDAVSIIELKAMFEKLKEIWSDERVDWVAEKFAFAFIPTLESGDWNSEPKAKAATPRKATPPETNSTASLLFDEFAD